MKTLLSFVMVAMFLVSCASKDKEDDPQFATMTKQFLKEYWAVHPAVASEYGLSEYDAILEIPDAATRDKKQQFYKRNLQLFAEVDTDELSYAQRTDLALILNKMESSLWKIETFRAHEWDPAKYNIGNQVSYVLERNNRSLEDSLKLLSEKLLKVPQYYQAAKNNLKRPTKEHTQFAIEQNKGLVGFLNGEVKKRIKSSKLTRREKSTLRQRVSAAAAAAKRYSTFLKGVLSRPESVDGLRSFRLGPDLYEQLFKFEMQTGESPEAIYRKALAAKEEARSKIFEAAIALYPKYYGEKLPPKDRQTVINNIMSKVTKQHPKPENFVATVREQIPALTQFVREKNLLTLDPSKPLKVRETPPYDRGFAGASVDSPGPFDKDRETYYNVTPLDGMTRKQKKSYLQEYNDYTLQILNIHEAIPGHYAQQVYGNQSDSIIKAVFRSTATVEGWAVYAERMMLEQGYGDGSMELWLMYYKWFLRVVTNTIIDYEVHNKDLSKKEAMKLLMVDAFQERAEAQGKWHRATISQVQLVSYFAGFSEIYELREDIKKEEGSDFDLKKFHETFLSFGNAPVKEIRKLML